LLLQYYVKEFFDFDPALFQIIQDHSKFSFTWCKQRTTWQ